jgi:hypothetical protein
MRDHLIHPEHYDKMIELVMLHSVHAGDIDFATNAVNNCIRGALRNEDPTDTYTIGGCMAIYTRDGRVRLFLEPRS